MKIDTTFLLLCIGVQEQAEAEICRYREADNDRYDIFRDVCVEQFQLVLDQSGKVLPKRLAAFFASNWQPDRLAFKDLFRRAARHGLIDADAAERWLANRNNCNDTERDFGEEFGEATLKLLPAVINDAKGLADTIEAAPDD